MHNYFNGRGTFGFTCDVCGRELNTCSIVNGMKFCAKCYQETFGKDNQQSEIQSLKQQLVEKQNKIDEISKEFVQVVHAVYDWRVLCAEKDKEIEKLKTYRYAFKRRLLSKMDIFRRNIELQFAQTQLAIRELEKVKELLLDEYKKYPIVYDKTNDIVAGALDRDKVNEIIDQQIKELKR